MLEWHLRNEMKKTDSWAAESTFFWFELLSTLSTQKCKISGLTTVELLPFYEVTPFVSCLFDQISQNSVKPGILETFTSRSQMQFHEAT